MPEGEGEASHQKMAVGRALGLYRGSDPHSKRNRQLLRDHNEMTQQELLQNEETLTYVNVTGQYCLISV